MNVKIILPFIIVACTSCTPWKLAVPTRFAEQSTLLKIKGADGKHVSFGNYKTSRIKRKWQRGSVHRTGGFVRVNSEDIFRDIFGVSTKNTVSTKRQKFKFQIHENDLSAEIFAMEGEVINSVELMTRSGSGWLDLIGHTNNYQYNFLATILPETVKYKDPWKLLLASAYDRKTDTSAPWFRLPYVEEQGYATNEMDSIFIRTFYPRKTVNANGKETKIPLKLKFGFELTWDGGVVCIIDAVGKNLWLYNGLDPSEKLLLAAISTALLIRRIRS